MCGSPLQPWWTFPWTTGPVFSGHHILHCFLLPSVCAGFAVCSSLKIVIGVLVGLYHKQILYRVTTLFLFILHTSPFLCILHFSISLYMYRFSSFLLSCDWCFCVCTPGGGYPCCILIGSYLPGSSSRPGEPPQPLGLRRRLLFVK